MAKEKQSSLSPKVKALIASGASALVILGQFLGEKEGTSLTVYLDSAKIATVCTGHMDRTMKVGTVYTKKQCDDFFKSDIGTSFAAVNRQLVPMPPNAASLAGVTSFCGYNIGEGKCAKSTFRKLWNAGDRPAACKQILLWIMDGGKDCRIRANGCFGQVERRQQEAELCAM